MIDPVCSPAYYEQYLKAAQLHWWFRGRERVLGSISQSLGLDQTTGLVADVGSGPGGPIRTVFPKTWILAMDAGFPPVKANEQASGRVVADALSLPISGSYLDALCAFDVLEHLENDAAALREWHRALKPGGWLVLTVPAFQSLWSRHDALNGHYRRYRRRPMTQLLERAGFIPVKVTYFNMLLLPPIALIRLSQRLLPQKHNVDEPSNRLTHEELDFSWRLPAWIERGFESAFRIEAGWLNRWPLPVGVSLCVVARCRKEQEESHA